MRTACRVRRVFISPADIFDDSKDVISSDCKIEVRERWGYEGMSLAVVRGWLHFVCTPGCLISFTDAVGDTVGIIHR